MKKIFIGIDISKEKLNLCYMNAKEIVLEDQKYISRFYAFFF